MTDAKVQDVDRSPVLAAGIRPIAVHRHRFYANEERCAGCGSLEADNSVGFAYTPIKLRVCSPCLRMLGEAIR